MTKTIVLTGASDGIGASAARTLAARGHDLVLVGRSPEKTLVVAEQVGATASFTADFARLDDVRRLADEVLTVCPRIDVLANNAGGLFSGPTRTVDGFEKTFQVNHLAPTLLTHLLLDRLLESGAAVVNTSSIASRLFGGVDLDDLNRWTTFRSNKAYGNSKLANIFFTTALHERFHGEGLSSVAFHPGNVATNFASDTTSYLRVVYRTALSKLLIAPEQGGANLVHFIEGEPGVTWQSGEYYDHHRKLSRTNPQAYDPDVVRQHWEISASYLGIDW